MPDAPDPTPNEVLPAEILAFETAIRDLVGVALRSVADLDVSLAQFRLMLTLAESGPSSSGACAAALGVVASSVTRLADRLHTAGYLTRGEDPDNRSVVTLALTESGADLVRSVTERRRIELRRALAHLTPAERAACADSLRRLHAPLTSVGADESRRHLPL